jgi:ribosomal protein L16 Arg81 hydroxylase
VAFEPPVSRPAVVTPALARCTAAQRDTFAAEHWSRRPLLSRAAELPSNFNDLISASDVDELVAERALRTPFFKLVEDGSSLSGYTRTAVAGSQRLADLADADKVRELYAGGATLVLNSLHRLHPPVVRFCRQLALDLGHPTQCNAYVTPGGNARGFAFHHDTHDVFVLQVDGTKRWIVHEPVHQLPLRSQPRAGDDLVAEGAQPLLDVELHAGDALYLPRGYVHAAVTTEQRSIHLTVGVLSTTWYDVLEDTLGLAADELAFRDALPMSPLGTAREELPAFVKQAAQWLADLPIDQVQELLDKRLARAVPAEPLGMLAQDEAVRSVTAATVVRPRAGVAVWLRDGADGQVVVVLPDREVAVPRYVRPALERCLAGPVRAGDLAGPEFSAGDGVVLLRRLLREGAVVAAE